MSTQVDIISRRSALARRLLDGNTMRRSLAFVLISAAAGCAGEAPDLTAVDAAPHVDAGQGLDATPTVTFALTGKAKDYFTGLPLATVDLATEGMEPALAGTSDAAGDFRLDGVPPGSVFYVTTSRLQFRPTRNLPVRIDSESVQSDLLVVSLPDSRRQYTSLNLAPTAGAAVVFAELRRNNGMPFEGLALDAIVLVDSAAAPIGLGPYFFGAQGDLVSNLTVATSTGFGGRARVGFLDVPAGPVTLEVTSTTGMGAPQTERIELMATADGATLAVTGATGMGGGGSGARTFTADVYPKLQTAANGGLGCANCHTAGGLAAVLPYDLPVMMTYDAIKARLGVVDLITPADSLLLTKPLFEAPPNHPNATFLDVNDPDYRVFLQWISQGATL